MKSAHLLYLIIGGCALAIIGSCLPWFSINSMGETIESFSGLDRDGTITLILAIGALIVGLVNVSGKEKVTGIIGTILAGLVATIGVYDYMDIKNNPASSLGLGDVFKVTIDSGLYFVIAGGIVAVVGFILRLQKTAGPAGPPPVTH